MKWINWVLLISCSYPRDITMISSFAVSLGRQSSPLATDQCGAASSAGCLAKGSAVADRWSFPGSEWISMDG